MNVTSMEPNGIKVVNVDAELFVQEEPRFQVTSLSKTAWELKVLNRPGTPESHCGLPSFDVFEPQYQILLDQILQLRAKARNSMYTFEKFDEFTNVSVLHWDLKHFRFLRIVPELDVSDPADSFTEFDVENGTRSFLYPPSSIRTTGLCVVGFPNAHEQEGTREYYNLLHTSYWPGQCEKLAGDVVRVLLWCCCRSGPFLAALYPRSRGSSMNARSGARKGAMIVGVC